MTSAVSPKSRHKEKNQLICDSDKGGRGSKNPKILRTSYMEAPREFVDEICEAHAKPGEAAYNSSHDMDLSGDQGWMDGIVFIELQGGCSGCCT